MSGADRLFLTDLRALDRRLRAPVPSRTRVLSEMEADLEELTLLLEERGLSPEAARRRARETLVPDDASLAELEWLHAAPFERLVRRVPDDRLRRIERWLFLSCAVGVLSAILLGLWDVDLLRHASPFLAPVAVLGSVLVAVAARAAFLVWVRIDTDAGARWTTGTGVIAVGLVLLGAVSSVLDLHAIAERIAASPEEATRLAVIALQRAGGLGVVTLLLALLGGVVWLATRHRILVLVSRHARLVGDYDHSGLRENDA
jgi:hypothetical protein